MAELPFVAGPVGAIAPATALAGVAAAAWALPEPVLVRVGMNVIFDAGDVVLRVGRTTAPAAAAIALAGVLESNGIRVPRAAHGEAMTRDGLSVSAWERLVLVEQPVDWPAIGTMVARVHALPVDAVPAEYPVPPCESFPWWQLDDLLDDVGPDVDPTARAGLRATVERHRGWADRGRGDGDDRVVCHGDVHPGNVAMTAAGPVLLDWDLLCRGPAGWDHAPLLRPGRWGWPTSWYDGFAAGYGRSLVGEPVTEAIADLRLVAATLLRVRAARLDPSARAEVERRLAYWRADREAATWTAA
ncbi:MAG: aminoglycoside phosphotransferase family protein [Ilumatobacteraceae bacterium]